VTILVIAVLFVGRGQVAQPAAIASPTATATPTGTPTATITKTNVPDQARVFCGTLAENSIKTGQGSAPNSFELRSPTGASGAPFMWTLNAATPALGTYLCGRFELGAPMLGLLGLVGPGDPAYVPQTYVHATQKFSVTLPPPYRRSARLSVANPSPQNPAEAVLFDAFTARTEQDEAALSTRDCQPACPIRNYIAIVEIYAGQSQSPRDWYRSHGGQAGEKIEDTTVDGRTAIRVTKGVPDYMPVQLIVKDGDRIVRLGYEIYAGQPVPADATTEKLQQLVASFKFVP
jgi:hypothetical protein